MRKTKIIGTISDRRCDAQFLEQLHKKGLNCVRLNTAHQSEEDTLKVIQQVRKVSPDIALLLDTKGPEVRTTEVDAPIQLKDGATIAIGTNAGVGTDKQINVNYKHFCRDVPKGSTILIDDGHIELLVVKCGKTLQCKVIHGGELKSRKTVNVPNVHLALPALTPKDRSYLKFAKKNQLDFVAHSFVRNKEDIAAVRKVLGKEVRIIAKIENQEGVDHIDEIIDAADGIMVARGDLGVEIPAAQVPAVQKMMIAKCLSHAKPVITATHMLESMISRPRATRAEISDVANAVLDGSDCLMLSGETAYGDYPEKAVATMAETAHHNEFHVEPAAVQFAPRYAREGVHAFASVSVAEQMGADAIVVTTLNGTNARLVAAHRASVPVYAVCPSHRVAKSLALTYGITPVVAKGIHAGVRKLVAEKKVKKKAVVVGVTGTKPGEMNVLQTNKAGLF